MLSVIIPLYNKEVTIKQTLESIFNQEYKDYEIVIVDDGSTDNGIDIVKSFQSDKISIYCQSNKGPSAARNLGICKAKGEWIVFMDADDWFEPGAFKQFNLITKSHPEKKIFCWNYYIYSNTTKFLYSVHYRNGFVKNNYFAWCVSNLSARAGATVFSKKMLNDYLFDESLKRYEDAEQLFRIMDSEKIYRCSTPVMTYNCNSIFASKACLNINDDFIGHLTYKNNCFWKQYAMLQFLWQGERLYPNIINKKYNRKDFVRLKFKFASIIIVILKRLHIQ